MILAEIERGELFRFDNEKCVDDDKRVFQLVGHCRDGMSVARQILPATEDEISLLSVVPVKKLNVVACEEPP